MDQRFNFGCPLMGSWIAVATARLHLSPMALLVVECHYAHLNTTKYHESSRQNEGPFGLLIAKCKLWGCIVPRPVETILPRPAAVPLCKQIHIQHEKIHNSKTKATFIIKQSKVDKPVSDF